MKLLNLANPETSEIKYKISKFPDGQQTIAIIDTAELRDDEGFAGLSDTPLYHTVSIKSRLNSWRDIELIIGANQALLELGVYDIHLFIPYFLGARSDRKFVTGTSNYLKTVIAPVINSQKFNSVTVVDPHSDVLEACINDFRKIDNVDLVKFALSDIVHPSIGLKRTFFISPDAGALKKVYHVAENVGYTNEVIIASKHRDIVTGNILETRVPGVEDLPNNTDFILIDDICDGGRTFIELAKAIKAKRPGSRDNYYLIITHGIFSAGFRELSKWFTAIYCTDSVKEIPAEQYEEFIGANGKIEKELVVTKCKQAKLF